MTFPKYHPLLSSVTNIEGAFRFLVYGSYIVFCHLCGNAVSIGRILYGNRDYLRILFGEE